MPGRNAVLFIEDETSIRELVAPELAEAGFEVEAAARAEQALLLFRKRTADFCAVVTDVNLGVGLTGWEIARLIRELAADIPVIYATGNVHEFAVNAVPNSAVLAKPYAPAEVVSVVLALIDNKPAPAAAS